MLDGFSDLNFQAAAEQVASRRADPYTIIDGWLTRTSH
jgi:hypothetical protein